jgi:hypothetical protein
MGGRVSMSHGKNVWVGPHENGWQVKQEGDARPLRVVSTQQEAIDIGRPIAAQNGSELVIQRPNGQIRDKDSHGDESPKKDKDGHRK